MKSNKKQKMSTAYQKHLDFTKAMSIILLAVPIACILIVSYVLEKQFETNIDVLYYIFATAIFGLIAGISLGVIASIKQNVADSINENLYAIWKYKPETIYRFYRKMCKYEKKTSFWNFFLSGLFVLVIGTIMYNNNVAHFLGIVFIVGAILLMIIGITKLPYSQYLLLKLRTKIMGDAKEIIFSRSGIWYCGKVCYFGDNGITYHRVERKEIHGQDAIIFYYTHTRGFQQTAKELAIPVAPKMAYAADALVAEFNRSDLLTK